MVEEMSKNKILTIPKMVGAREMNALSPHTTPQLYLQVISGPGLFQDLLATSLVRWCSGCTSPLYEGCTHVLTHTHTEVDTLTHSYLARPTHTHHRP